MAVRLDDSSIKNERFRWNKIHERENLKNFKISIEHFVMKYSQRFSILELMRHYGVRDSEA